LPVKLIVSMFGGQASLLAQAEAALVARYGPIDYASPLLPFAHTDYYAPEFGTGLQRRLAAFAELIDPGDLADVKVWTNELEQRLAQGGRRRVNLDPGYLTAAKLVLATTKDHAHRVYLREGIYAEVTLSYQGKAWRTLPWTYPDYGSPTYLRLVGELRARFMAQIKELPPDLTRQSG
jgi:hypothetical protein